MGFLTVKGEFKKYSGELLFDGKTLKSISTEVLVESIQTKDASRDETILSKGYLDVKNYPHMSFTSIAIENNNGEKILIGSLTIKEKQKKIKVPTKIVFSDNQKEVQLTLTTKISRKEYRLDFGTMNALIGNTITIDLLIIGKVEK